MLELELNGLALELELELNGLALVISSDWAHSLWIVTVVSCS